MNILIFNPYLIIKDTQFTDWHAVTLMARAKHWEEKETVGQEMWIEQREPSGWWTTTKLAKIGICRQVYAVVIAVAVVAPLNHYSELYVQLCLG